MKNQVSIIIPMYNASSYIESCLSSISNQTINNFEVVLVDDCSTDDTVQKAQSYPFKIIRLKERLRPAGVRNHGARNASGNVFVFLDADVSLKPDSIENITRLISEPDTDAISGIYSEDILQTNLFSQLQNLILVYRYSKLSNSTILTCSFFCAIKRNAFEAVGGYNEKMRYYEDVEIGHRLTRKGYRCKFDPRLAVTHLKYYNHSGLLRDYFKKAVVMSNYVKRGNSIRKILGNGWSLSLKVVNVSTGCILLSIGLIKISIIQFLFFLIIHSISIIPLLFYLIKTRGLAFGLKSYVVLLEIFLLSLSGVVCGILKYDKDS